MLKLKKKQITMKKFNQSIEVKVEVDAIAQQLREMFKEDSAHADVVVEQIIGRSLCNDMGLLGKIMSAMNGFEKQIIVKVGDIAKIKPISIYGFWTKDSITNNDSCKGEVNEVEVLEVNPYSDSGVLVGFQVPQKDGSMNTQQKWISASQFTV
jgi:hypothetical protein